MSHKIQIIGIGDDGLDGLTQYAYSLIEKAEVVLGPTSLLEKLPPASQEKVSLSADLEQVAGAIEQHLDRQAIMLAGGDPLFYGTTRFLCDRFGKDRFEVLPHVSSMQLAFARVKESWDEAYLTNLATQHLATVVGRIRSAEKVGLFTSEECSPAELARYLLEQKIDYFTAYVCENLGSPDECVTRGTLHEISEQEFSSLNVTILIRNPGVPDRPEELRGKKLFGNPDEVFLQSQPKRGLLTPCEVRVIALSQMDLGQRSVVWDVGAGSGSVAIEAAQLCSSGAVFAIEMDVEDYNLMVENSRNFGTENLTPILGEAPQAWNELPDPDAIFIGGTGRVVVTLVKHAWDRLKDGGRFVIQLASLENLTSVEGMLRGLGCEPQVLMINLSRGQRQLDALRLESANPTFLISVQKPN